MNGKQETKTVEKEKRAITGGGIFDNLETIEKETEIETEIETGSQETETTAPYEIYNNIIYGIVDEFIDREYPEKTVDDLKQDKAFFPLLVDYLYNNYIGELLNNKGHKNTNYNIYILDNLFNIYKKLVYLYKWNNKPYIIEFALFTGINKNTFYNWLNGMENRAGELSHDELTTRERCDIVQNWVDTCERALLDNNDTIKDIFILKAKHGYRDNNNDIQITVNHKAIIDADNLPDLIGLKSQ